MNREKITVEVPGKLFLTGEYAILFGGTAIISSVNKYAVISVSASNSQSSVTSSILNINNSIFSVKKKTVLVTDKNNEQKLIFIKAALEIFLNQFPQFEEECNRINLDINTSQFYADSDKKMGFGSSASVTAGVLKALNLFFRNTNFSSEELFNLASEAHSRAQSNTGSGGDIAVAAYSGVIRFARQESSKVTINPVVMPDDLSIYTIWTGISCSTSGYISAVMQLRENQPRVFEQIMTRLIKMAKELADDFTKRRQQNFFDHIDVYYLLLKELGESAGINIISEEHIKIYEIVKAFGGFYKPSGAGGGDVGLAFFEHPVDEPKLAYKLATCNFKLLDLRFGV